MGKTSSNLLFLAAGAAIGAAVGYIAAHDRRDELLQNIVNYACKLKDSAVAMAERGEDNLEELVDDLDGE